MKCRAWPPCSSLKSRRLQALAERCVALSPGVLDAPTLGTTGHVVVDHDCLAHVLELGPDGRLIACRGASGNFDRGQRPVLALNEIVITEGRLVVRPPVGAIPFLQETLIKKTASRWLGQWGSRSFGSAQLRRKRRVREPRRPASRTARAPGPKRWTRSRQVR